MLHDAGALADEGHKGFGSASRKDMVFCIGKANAVLTKEGDFSLDVPDGSWHTKSFRAVMSNFLHHDFKCPIRRTVINSVFSNKSISRIKGALSGEVFWYMNLCKEYDGLWASFSKDLINCGGIKNGKECIVCASFMGSSIPGKENIFYNKIDDVWDILWKVNCSKTSSDCVEWLLYSSLALHVYSAVNLFKHFSEIETEAISEVKKKVIVGNGISGDAASYSESLIRCLFNKKNNKTLLYDLVTKDLLSLANPGFETCKVVIFGAITFEILNNVLNIDSHMLSDKCDCGNESKGEADGTLPAFLLKRKHDRTTIINTEGLCFQCYGEARNFLAVSHIWGDSEKSYKLNVKNSKIWTSESNFSLGPGALLAMAYCPSKYFWLDVFCHVRDSFTNGGNTLNSDKKFITKFITIGEVYQVARATYGWFFSMGGLHNVAWYHRLWTFLEVYVSKSIEGFCFDSHFSMIIHKIREFSGNPWSPELGSWVSKLVVTGSGQHYFALKTFGILQDDMLNLFVEDILNDFPRSQIEGWGLFPQATIVDPFTLKMGKWPIKIALSNKGVIAHYKCIEGNTKNGVFNLICNKTLFKVEGLISKNDNSLFHCIRVKEANNKYDESEIFDKCYVG
ncbi:MAG: hypothetical protein LBE23_10255 [Vagococcus sp.]|jgi:hypothetical protein|nr:hypothetical protein [Vagococcus sp.]